MNTAARAVRLLKTSPLVVAQKRNISPRWGHVIPLPPTVKIPFAEKILLGSFMVCGLLSIPVWVLYNLEYYKTGGVRTDPTTEPPRELDMMEETVLELSEQNKVAEGRK